MFNFFFKKKSKVKLNCLGFYDTKPYDALGYSLVYAKHSLIYEDNNVHVYYRKYHNTIFVITLVDNEEGIVFEDYTYDKMKHLINDTCKSVINLMVFQNSNDYTIGIAKKVRENTNEEFNQVLVFNVNEVRLEYYRPVPKFMSLYNDYCEAIYFDLTAIDPNRE